jgi:tight adherence protein B
MLLLGSGFFLILALTFGLVVGLSGPSRAEKVVQQRLVSVTSIRSGEHEVALEASQLLRKTATSRFGFLDSYVSHHASMQKLRRYVTQAGLNTTASAVLVQSLGLAAVGFLGALVMLPQPVIEGAAALVLALLPWARIMWARSRRVRAFDKALPQAIDMMARALRAGHSTSGSIEIITQGAPEPAASEFGEVFRQQNFGLPLRDALMQLLDRVPSQDLRVMVTAIVVQRETGGNLVEILDRTVFVIRERQRIHGEIRTQTAQGRMTGWILAALPVGMMVMINMINPGYSSILFHTKTGHMLLYAGAGLLTLGTVVINRIINGIDV